MEYLTRSLYAAFARNTPALDEKPQQARALPEPVSEKCADLPTIASIQAARSRPRQLSGMDTSVDPRLGTFLAGIGALDDAAEWQREVSEILRPGNPDQYCFRSIPTVKDLSASPLAFGRKPLSEKETQKKLEELLELSGIPQYGDETVMRNESNSHIFDKYPYEIIKREGAPDQLRKSDLHEDDLTGLHFEPALDPRYAYISEREYVRHQDPRLAGILASISEEPVEVQRDFMQRFVLGVAQIDHQCGDNGPRVQRHAIDSYELQKIGGAVDKPTHGGSISLEDFVRTVVHKHAWACTETFASQIDDYESEKRGAANTLSRENFGTHERIREKFFEEGEVIYIDRANEDNATKLTLTFTVEGCLKAVREALQQRWQADSEMTAEMIKGSAEGARGFFNGGELDVHLNRDNPLPKRGEEAEKGILLLTDRSLLEILAKIGVVQSKQEPGTAIKESRLPALRAANGRDSARPNFLLDAMMRKWGGSQSGKIRGALDLLAEMSPWKWRATRMRGVRASIGVPRAATIHRKQLAYSFGQAVCEGDMEKVKRLYHGAAISEAFPDKTELLDFNFANGDGLLHHAASKRHDDVFCFLLEQGANPRKANSAKTRPIHAAAHFGLRKGMDLLLEKLGEEDIDAATIDIESGKKLHTPLMTAAVAGQAYATLALLRRGANYDWVRPITCEGPLDMAARQPNPAIARLLLMAGAAVDPIPQHYTGRIGDTLIPFTKVGTPAIHTAAKRGHWGVVKVLLEHGAKVEDQDGKTAQQVAQEAGFVYPEYLITLERNRATQPQPAL